MVLQSSYMVWICGIHCTSAVVHGLAGPVSRYPGGADPPAAALKEPREIATPKQKKINSNSNSNSNTWLYILYTIILTYMYKAIYYKYNISILGKRIA